MAGERRSLDDLHPRVRLAVQQILSDLAREGLPFEVFEAYRTPQRQHALFKQGSVTRADAWQSYHQYGLAVDLVWKDNNGWSWNTSGGRLALWKRMNEIGRAHGLEPLSWELPHLQLAGIRLADLRAGRYPPGGDESWAEALAAAIESWPAGAPPLPQLGAERPPIAGLEPPDPVAVPDGLPADPGSSRATFERAQAIIKQYEGGFSNNPADPGGPTNWGITHTTLARWRGVPAVSAEDVRAMSYEEAKDIYFARYWNEMHCGAMPPPLALALYNIGIHCGVRTAADFLQQAVIAQGVRITHDLDIGPETIGAIGRCDPAKLLRSVLDDYETRLRMHPRFDVFGKGFMNRVAHLRQECAAWLAEMQAEFKSMPDAAAGLAKEREPMTMPQQPNSAAADMPVLLLSRLLELIKGQDGTRDRGTGQQEAPARPGLDPASLALIQSILSLMHGTPPQPPPAPAPATGALGPVNGALGQGIGQLLNGRKSAIGIIGSVLVGILQQSAPDGVASKLAGAVTSAVPMLAGASGPLLPVFMGMLAWGVLGKFEKYQTTKP